MEEGTEGAGRVGNMTLSFRHKGPGESRNGKVTHTHTHRQSCTDTAPTHTLNQPRPLADTHIHSLRCTLSPPASHTLLHSLTCPGTHTPTQPRCASISSALTPSGLHLGSPRVQRGGGVREGWYDSSVQGPVHPAVCCLSHDDSGAEMPVSTWA